MCQGNINRRDRGEFLSCLQSLSNSYSCSINQFVIKENVHGRINRAPFPRMHGRMEVEEGSAGDGVQRINF